MGVGGGHVAMVEMDAMFLHKKGVMMKYMMSKDSCC